jgi:hypothetical protein
MMVDQLCCLNEYGFVGILVVVAKKDPENHVAVAKKDPENHVAVAKKDPENHVAVAKKAYSLVEYFVL